MTRTNRERITFFFGLRIRLALSLTTVYLSPDSMDLMWLEVVAMSLVGDTNSVGFDHINRNPPVLIRTPKLTRFEPAQYWGGGPPGNSVVLNPFFVVLSFFLPSPALVTSRLVYLFSCLCSLVSVLLSLFSCLLSLSSKVAKARQRLGRKPPFVEAWEAIQLWVFGCNQNS